MAVLSTSVTSISPPAGWSEYSFHGESKVRQEGPVDDPADLDIAYEQAKAKADREADAFHRLEGDATYTVYVRVVRAHRRDWPVK